MSFSRPCAGIGGAGAAGAGGWQLTGPHPFSPPTWSEVLQRIEQIPGDFASRIHDVTQPGYYSHFSGLGGRGAAPCPPHVGGVSGPPNSAVGGVGGQPGGHSVGQPGQPGGLEHHAGRGLGVSTHPLHLTFSDPAAVSSFDWMTFALTSVGIIAALLMVALVVREALACWR